MSMTLMTAAQARENAKYVVSKRDAERNALIEETLKKIDEQRRFHVISEILTAVQDGKNETWVAGGLVDGLKEELLEKGYTVSVDISETDGGQSTTIKW